VAFEIIVREASAVCKSMNIIIGKLPLIFKKNTKYTISRKDTKEIYNSRLYYNNFIALSNVINNFFISSTPTETLKKPSDIPKPSL